MANKAKMNSYNTVYMTRDYAAFKRIEGNRTLNKRNYAKLIASMKEKQLTIPIIVNKDMEIIDGQHRFTASCELGLPIYFIMEESYGIDEVKRANMVGTNWTKSDFLQMHVEDGVETYERVDEIIKIYEICISDLIKLLAIIKGHNINIIGKMFENGTLTISEEEEAQIYDFLEALEDFKLFKQYRTKQFFAAFLKLYFNENYDHSKMKDKLKTRGVKLVKKGSAKEYIQCLTKEIYSFGAVKKPLYYDMETDRFYV